MTLWRWCALFGVLTIVIALSFALVPDISACGPAKGAGQWVDFQNINRAADVATLIRPDCADRFVPALRASMWLDAVVFIPIYGSFLILAMGALRGGKNALLTAAFVALIGGMIADQIEGIRLLAILAALPGTDMMAAGVAHARGAKQVLLALATLLIGATMIGKTGWLKAAGGVIAAVSLLAIAGTMFRLDAGGVGLLIGWLGLAIVALVESLRAPARLPTK
jgi:hypothetical protein